MSRPNYDLSNWWNSSVLRDGPNNSYRAQTNIGNHSMSTQYSNLPSSREAPENSINSAIDLDIPNPPDITTHSFKSFASFPIHNSIKMSPEYRNARSAYHPSKQEIQEAYEEVLADLRAYSTIKLPESSSQKLNAHQIILATQFYFTWINGSPPLESWTPFVLLQMLQFPFLYTAQFYTKEGGWPYTVDVLYWLKQRSDFLQANESKFSYEDDSVVCDINSCIEYSELMAYRCKLNDDRPEGSINAIVGEIKCALHKYITENIPSGTDDHNNAQAYDQISDFDSEDILEEDLAHDSPLESELDNIERDEEVPDSDLDPDIARKINEQKSILASAQSEFEEVEKKYKVLNETAESLRSKRDQLNQEHSQQITILSVEANVESDFIRQQLDQYKKLQTELNSLDDADIEKLSRANDAKVAELLPLVRSVSNNLMTLGINVNELPLNNDSLLIQSLLSHGFQAPDLAAMNQKAANEKILNEQKYSTLKALTEQLKKEFEDLKVVEEESQISTLKSQIITVKHDNVKLESAFQSLNYERESYDNRKKQEMENDKSKLRQFENLQGEVKKLNIRKQEQGELIEKKIPRKLECEEIYEFYLQCSDWLNTAIQEISSANENLDKYCKAERKKIDDIKAVLLTTEDYDSAYQDKDIKELVHDLLYPFQKD